MKKSKRQDSPHQYPRSNNYTNGPNYKHSNYSSHNQNHHNRGYNQYNGSHNNHPRYDESYKKETDFRCGQTQKNYDNDSGRQLIELPISIEYKHERIELGNTWAEINEAIDRKIKNDKRLVTAIKLCILHKVKHQIDITDEEQRLVLREYAQAIQ